MPFDIAQIGANAANEAAGGILGIALGHINDKRQIAQQQKLTNIQLAANQQMASYNNNLNYEMWKKTNYPAQVEMLKQAGLNPALLYGEGGGGGTTAAGGGVGGVSGATAQQNAGEAMGMSIEMANLQLLKAQKANIDADTKNKEADTANKPLIGENIKSSTENLTASTGNIQADTKLKDIQTQLDKLDAQFLQGSMNDRLKQVNTTLEQSLVSLEIMKNDKWLNDQTMYSKSEIIQQEAIAKFIGNLLTSAQIENTQAGTQKTKSEIAVNEQQIKTMAANIQQGWKGLDQKDTELAIKAFAEQMKADYPSLWNVAGKIVNEEVQSLFEIVTGKQPKRYNQAPKP